MGYFELQTPGFHVACNESNLFSSIWSSEKHCSYSIFQCYLGKHRRMPCNSVNIIEYAVSSEGCR